jgi:hypothetical protein
MFSGEKEMSKTQNSWEEVQGLEERHLLPVGVLVKAASLSSHEVLRKALERLFLPL